MGGKTVPKYMKAAFAPDAALLDCTIIDFARATEADGLTRCFTQEEQRAVMASFALALCSPVVRQFLEQTLTQWQDALLGSLALADS
jgi:hypothetical protein